MDASACLAAAPSWNASVNAPSSVSAPCCLGSAHADTTSSAHAASHSSQMPDWRLFHFNAAPSASSEQPLQRSAAPVENRAMIGQASRFTSKMNERIPELLVSCAAQDAQVQQQSDRQQQHATFRLATKEQSLHDAAAPAAAFAPHQQILATQPQQFQTHPSAAGIRSQDTPGKSLSSFESHSLADSSRSSEGWQQPTQQLPLQAQPHIPSEAVPRYQSSHRPVPVQMNQISSETLLRARGGSRLPEVRTKRSSTVSSQRNLNTNSNCNLCCVCG